MRLGYTFLLLLILACGPILADEDACVDGVDNLMTVESYGNHSLPVKVTNVKILVYDMDYKPSCYKGKVNVVMPGIFKILSGEVHTSRTFDIIKDGDVRASVALEDDDICAEGKSAMMLVPDYICRFDIISFVPKDICEFLQRKGVHTLAEMEQELNFNSTLELPPSPSFLGITLLDILQGDYRIKIALWSEGNKILEFTLPADYAALQMGMTKEED